MTSITKDRALVFPPIAFGVIDVALEILAALHRAKSSLIVVASRMTRGDDDR